MLLVCLLLNSVSHTHTHVVYMYIHTPPKQDTQTHTQTHTQNHLLPALPNKRSKNLPKAV